MFSNDEYFYRGKEEKFYRMQGEITSSAKIS